MLYRTAKLLLPGQKKNKGDSMGRRTIDFGIDLGTTNSEIACIQNGEVRVFKNYRNEEATPSAVLIDNKGTIIVGRKAYDRHVDDPDNTVIEFKRWMGTQQVKEFKATGSRMTAEELSAEVLKDLKVTAKSRSSDEDDIVAAVITVPCNFEDIQCDATQRAAKLAGIKYAPLLQEPIAASIAYGFLERMPKGYWVVYDLGGGTTDIAIMSAKEGRLSVVEHCGDNYLGGKDFDWKIVERIVYPTLSKAYDLPNLGRSSEYAALNAILKKESELARIELSQRESADINIFTGGARVTDKSGKVIDLSIPIKRSEYEHLIEEDVDKTIVLFEQALKNQGLSSGDVNQLLLVGGPTLTPYVRHKLKDKFNIPIDYKIDPLTVVAQGAAIFAASQLMPDELTKRDRTKVFIKLSYDPMTTADETMVGGKVEPKEGGVVPGGMQVQIDRVGGDWQSGKIPVKNGAFLTNVSLLARKLNVFNVLLLDEQGNRVMCEPETFSITQGISIAEPPLIRSIGVELEDGTFDKIVMKGTSLPSRSKPFTYQTSREVRPGESSDMLNIHVKEGESGIAKRNRHLGTLSITGEKVRRAIPEDSKIEIVICVDKSREVTAEAYIESLDQKFKGILGNKIAPKPDPDLLSNDLKKEEDRLAELKRDVQRTGDSSLQHKLGDANVESKIDEIRNDLQAAKGGDPDAVEKVDRRIKDLQILLDPLEHLAEWPAELAKFNGIYKDCENTVNAYGNNDDKDRLETLRKEADKVITDKDTKKLQKITEEMIQIYWGILFRQDGFWINVFQDIKNKPMNYSNKMQAQELIKEGNMALQRQDLESLKTIVGQLWELMPKEKQEEVGKRVSDSGLRKSW